MNKLKIGITSGDINGIGLEVILKVLSFKEIRLKADFYLFSSPEIITIHQKSIKSEVVPFFNVQPGGNLEPGVIGLCDPWDRSFNVQFGIQNNEGGIAAFDSLDFACSSIENKKIDALITAPLCKANIPQSKYLDFKGHTEYLANRFNSSTMMIMTADKTRVALASDHIPLSEISETVNVSYLNKKIDEFNLALKFDFDISNPKIAILGLNPHAGDGGKIGLEEKNTIIPCIQLKRKEGIIAHGPFPSDSFFGKKLYLQFDGVLAIYHDQGLIPFKMLYFEKGVNNTCGLPFIRTSPDHGVAFDIAGQNLADETSFRESIFHAIKRTKARQEYTA
mgnify:FL=1